MNEEADFGRKRKSCFRKPLSEFNQRDGGDDGGCETDPDDELTALSLSFPSSRQRITSPTPIALPFRAPLDIYSLQSPVPQQTVMLRDADAAINIGVPVRVPVSAQPASNPRGCGRRRAASSAAKETAPSETITPPYPWATDRRATIFSLKSLEKRGIEAIHGTVQCRKCEKTFEVEYNLQKKFIEVGSYIADNKASMKDRAPAAWMSPTLPQCKFCAQENSTKPVLPQNKDEINWLFLLLGQMIGCCTLDQLKYFCEHTKNHRTGAKDRIVYYTYLGLCKQLEPTGPFDP